MVGVSLFYVGDPSLWVYAAPEHNKLYILMGGWMVGWYGVFY